MLVDYYIEPLIADEEAADEVWALWYAGQIDGDLAALMWWVQAVAAQD